MAQEPQYEFCYKTVKLLKTENLGIGSYGAVCKAMCDDLPCAAKILHPTFFQFSPPGATSVMHKFERECHLLSAIKHPHIVQYLGTHYDPESKLPVLLMELMDESLTQFLERSHKLLPYHTEVNLCHDIALALSYLHSNGIVHRDLSSNNVLLIAGSRAKVADFGMVKLSTANLTPLTMCPGTMVYMSPETLRDQSVYTDKLDSFSFGVLCVQIMTRKFPDPSKRVTLLEDSRFPTGTIEVPVPEIERRQSHISLIDPAHSLLPVALNCLMDREGERPSTQELCYHIAELKTSPQYARSVQQGNLPSPSEDREMQIRELNQQHAQQTQTIQGLQQQLRTLSDQLQEKEKENQQQQRQILKLQNTLTATNETLVQHLTANENELAGKDHELEQKETTIATCQQEIEQIRQQLQFSEQVTAEFQKNLLEREEMMKDQQIEIQELQQQLRQRQGSVKANGAVASGSNIKLSWRDGGRAPRGMFGEVVAVDRGVAYFRPEGYRMQIVLAYNCTNNKWSELPKCPNHSFSIAVISGLPTAIGGKTVKDGVTNSLLSLTDIGEDVASYPDHGFEARGDDKKWTEQFPPMPTKRCSTAVVCSGKSLVVAGGVGGYEDLSTVEVMDTETLEWSTASSLPHPLSEASATVYEDKVYMLGGFDHIGPSKSVFTCSLAALLQSWQPQSLGARLKTLSIAGRQEVWHKLAGTPFTFSTCASLRGELLAVGGIESADKKATTIIHMYNATTSSWEIISHMTTARWRCLVAVLPHDKLMVVGGDANNDSVEIADVV